MRREALYVLLTLPLLGLCADEGDNAQTTDSDPVGIDFQTVTNNLLERLDLEAGERVLLVGVPGRFDPIVPLLRAGFVAAGAEDLGAWAEEGEAPSSWGTDFTAQIAMTQGDALVDLLSDVDAAIMLPGATATHTVYGALQDVLRRDQGRTIHFHWLGAYDLDGAERSIDGMVDAFYQRVLVDTDYRALGEAQVAFEQAMRGSTIRVTTPAGTDISFQIGDRPVTKQDGDASAARAARGLNLIDREVELPAGAIRVAPIEETVEGVIVFPPSDWGGSRTEDLTLRFERGVMVSLEATAGADAARAEIEAAGSAGEAFREFALGFNPLLAIPTEGERWIPYYGYGAGVVRLSLGDNTELGGNVGGGYVRWNFFVDATVEVDGEVWVDEGRLVRN
jgi:hypothetical protein